MATGIFKSFVSTARRWYPATWRPEYKILTDALTGAPVGIQSPNANGSDGIWAPVDLTAAQIASPTPDMLADINATYRLNESPYTRYQSDGGELVPIGGEQFDGNTFPGAVLQTIPSSAPALTIGPNSYGYVFSPLSIQNAGGVTVLGRLDVVNRPT